MKKIERKKNLYHEWASVVLMPVEQIFNYIIHVWWWEQVTFQRDDNGDNDVCYLLVDQQETETGCS